MMTGHASMIPSDLPDRPERATVPTSEHAALLFAQGQALALPPGMALARPPTGRPLIHSRPRAILAPGEVAAALGCPAAEAGGGRIAAGVLDRRLDGLEVSVDLYRMSHGSGASLVVGVVGPDPERAGRPGATTARLWRLATAAVARLGIPSEHLIGFGDDGFLALYGVRAAQVAWLDGERLVTVSATSLAEDKDWVIAAARAVARLVAARLEA